MTVTCMEILGRDGENRPILPLPRRRKDALAEFCRRTWPGPGRRKAVMAQWDLNVDEARSVIEGTSSEPTWEKIKEHARGGWWVAGPVTGATIGHDYATFLKAIADEQSQRAVNATARADHFRGLEARAAELVGLCARPLDGPQRGAAHGLGVGED